MGAGTGAGMTQDLVPGMLRVQCAGLDPVALVLAGDLDRCSYPSLGRMLAELEQGGVRRVELDLSGVDLVDIRAAQWLYAQRRAMQARGCELAIRGATPWVSRVLGILGVQEVLTAN